MLFKSFIKWYQFSSTSISAHQNLLCLCVYAAKAQYWRINMLFHPSIYFIALVLRPRIAFLNCTVTTRPTHTQTHTYTQSTPGETFLEGSHQSVLWLSLGKFPPLQSSVFPPSALLLDSLSYISICISFGSHLRTIHSSQLSSTIFPIPLRDNWNKLESEIFAWTIRDKTFATGFLVHVFNLPASDNKPERGESAECKKKCP